jgi:PAS domain S-box-containing protein
MNPGKSQLRLSEAAKHAAILNAVPAHIALLDTQGRIISVNEAWRRFVGANVLQAPGHEVGLNYLETCDRPSEDDASEAHQVAEGIRSVLGGGVKSFSIEYACHSPTEQRWFLMTVTPVTEGRPNGAVVMHLNITARKKADQKFKDLVEFAPDAMVIVNRDAEIVLVNSQAADLFGWRREELLGQKIEILVPERFRARHAGHRNGFFAQSRVRAMGAALALFGLRKDGTEFPAEISLSPLETDEGTLVMSAIRDITERRRAEGAVRAAESRLQSVVNSAPITIWATDSAGVFTLSDGLALGRAGLKPGENVGVSALELFGAMPFTTHDGTAATGRELLGRALAGESVIGVNEYGGTVFENHIGPQFGLDGTVVGAVGVATDITDRVKAQAALRLSEERFRAIFARAPVGIAISDALTGRIVTVNDEYARILGRTIDEIRDLDWMSVTHPDDVTRDLPKLAALQSGEIPIMAMEKRYLRPDGTLVWVKMRAVLLPGVGDGSAYVLAMAGDITEGKLAIEALEQSNERLKRLSARLLGIRETERRQLARELHDEIGQTLSAVKINLQSIERFPDPAALAPRLADSVRIVERALHQVRSLSLLLHPPLLDDMGLTAALQWLVDESGRRTGVLTELHASISESRFDPTIEIACFRIVQEALNNVEKHAGAQSATVELHVEGGNLQVTVSDDGNGFDVPDARRHAAEGQSLGILSMEERATLAGGGIEWESVPGDRTTVRVWFPVTERTVAPGAEG